MKAVSIALSMFIFVLFTITLVACDNATSGTDHGSGDISNSCNNGNCSDAQIQQNEDGQISNDESGQTSHCGDGVCNIFEGDTPENCLNCADDCPCSNGLVCNDVGTCGEDPLTDYYWLEGQWQREEDKLIYDITVTGWDKKKGAQVEGFSPCSIGWAIKDGDGSQLLFTGQSELGDVNCSDGKIDVLNKKNPLTAIQDDGFVYTVTYVKI